MKKILIVEDDKIISKGLSYLLSSKYEVLVAKSVKEAISFDKEYFDLLLLDLFLPDGYGYDVVENSFKNVPVIFLTANDNEEDIVKGLSIGEDYIHKPFKNAELVMRIEKVLKRFEKNIFCYDKVIIDYEKYLISVDNNILEVTPLEFDILKLLFENHDKVVTRDKIISLIWDSNNKFVNDNTLSVYIKRIREKFNYNYIKTIKGIGYMVSLND